MSRIRKLRGERRSDETPERDDRKHLLLVVDQLRKALGGGERIVLKMARLLPAYGYRVSILTFAVDDESAALVDAPCPIYLLPLKKTYGLDAMRGALALRRFLKREKVVLVHTCFESSDLWAGGITKLLSGAKLVWNRRDMGILRSRKHVIAYRTLSKVPDAVFAVSEQVRRHSIDVDGIPPERVLTIHNGLDLLRWPERARAAQGDAPVLASLGNIRRIKGHDVLVRSFAKVLLEFPRAKLVLGGAVLEADFMRELEALVKELEIVSNVFFEGDIQDQQSFLQRATLFVLPSRSEGFSNAIVEAMAASLPVVATDVGGNAEAVLDGHTGLVVVSEDVEGMAAAMLRFLRDPALAISMGKAGRQRVIDEFTTEAMMGRFVSTFDRLLQQT